VPPHFSRLVSCEGRLDSVSVIHNERRIRDHSSRILAAPIHYELRGAEGLARPRAPLAVECANMVSFLLPVAAREIRGPTGHFRAKPCGPTTRNPKRSATSLST